MNKTIRFTKIIIIALAIITLGACKKDSLTLLNDSIWNFENFSTESENTDIQSLIALGKAVLTDGTLEFSSDGTYEMNSPVMNAETGTWELVGSSQLILTTSAVRTATIDEISKSKLVYYETYLYLGAESYSVKYVWVK